MKKTIVTIIMMLVICIWLVPVTANAASESYSLEDGEIIGCKVRTFEETVGYETSNSNEIVCTIPKDEKLIVEGEENGRFLVLYKHYEVYISSNQVLLNIFDYIPSLDIRLDMAKRKNYFSMGGKNIVWLTNRRFYNSEGSVAQTEAWLKYEPAKKLLNAQMEVLQDGYCIVIYDAYRPYTVTKMFQEAYRNFLNEQTNEFKTNWFGELGESWFLAQKASSHNYGIALDLSLRYLTSDELVKMPSRIHTLDKRSAEYYWMDEDCLETVNAKYLKEVMESVGFTYLKSEWWHFQDNTVERGNVIDIAN